MLRVEVAIVSRILLGRLDHVRMDVKIFYKGYKYTYNE
jgi:hypothetical protein